MGASAVKFFEVNQKINQIRTKAVSTENLEWINISEVAGDRSILIIAKSVVAKLNFFTVIIPQYISSYQYYSVRNAKANDV